MASRPGANAQNEVRQLVKKMDEAWLKGRPEELNECFHDDIVMKGPDFHDLGRGEEFCSAALTLKPPVIIGSPKPSIPLATSSWAGDTMWVG